MEMSGLPLSVFPLKLTRPELQAVYPRTRLFDILSTHIHHRALWVCGPAGSGKTTLVNSFIDAQDFPCIWYNIDEQDRDLSSFFYYMGNVAKQIDPEKYPQLPFLTQEFFPGVASFTNRFFELFATILPSRYVMVLDNYQDAGEDVLLHEVLCHAINSLQKQVTFIILSRKEPPDVLVAASAKCRIQMLGWHHLQLDIRETGGIIQCISGKAFDEKNTADIHTKTGGWVAGLLLLLKRGEFDNIEPCMLTRKTPEVIFDYLNSVVYQSLDPADQTILLTLCHLPAISRDAAAALCGKQALVLLEKLNKENLFVHRITTDSPGYDFHPLFREFLQKRSVQFFPRSDLTAILSKSADILNQEGNVEAAVELYLDADNYDRAVALILTHALIFSIQGRVATLLQWIGSLPPGIVNATPWLLFWKGVCVIPESPESAKPFFQQALALFEQAGDPAGCFMALAGIMDSISLQFSLFQELDLWVDRYTELENQFGPVDIPEIRMKLTSSMLHALVLRRPDSPMLKNWESLGWEILQTVKDVNKTVSIFSPLIILNIFKGELQTAGHLLKMFTDVSHKKTAPLSYLILQDLKIFHSWMNGDFQAGFEAALDGMKVEKITGIRLIFLGLRVQGAAAAIGLGRLNTARQLLDEIPPFLAHQGIWMQGLYHIVSSWLYDRLDDFANFRFHAVQSFKKNYESGNSLVRSGAHLNIARLHFKAKKFRSADAHLERCLKIADQFNLNQDTFMALLTRAGLYFSLNYKEKACTVLHRALQMGRQRNYRYGLFWAPKEMATLCATALKENMETDYVRALITHHHLIPDPLPLDIPDWPWPVDISSFGGFSVRINGEKAAPKGKGKKQPILLIKYLLARGGRGVPEYHIQDALWPGSDGDAAQNAYSTTLHRARKFLGDNAALVHSQGRLSFNDRVVRTDTALFEQCCTRIEDVCKALSSGKIETENPLLSALDLLFSVYRGPFLDGDQDAWVFPMADRLRSRYTGILEKAGQILAGHGNFHAAIRCYRRGVSAEPLTESFYRGMIQSYLKMGQPIDAARVYKQYEARCHMELRGDVLSGTMTDLKNEIFKQTGK